LTQRYTGPRGSTEQLHQKYIYIQCFFDGADIGSTGGK